jgi:hypothetical protein
MEAPLAVLLNTWIERLLALAGSGFLGYLWYQSNVVDKGSTLRKLSPLSNGVFALSTTLGGLLITKWHGEVNPWTGLFWIVGLIVGFWGAHRYVTNTIVNSVLAQSGHDERAQVRSLVKGRLLREGAKAAEQQALDCVRQSQVPEKDAALRATAELHRFIHNARNRAVKEFAKMGRNLAEAAAGRGAFTPDLSAYLEEVVVLYRELLANVTGDPEGLWVALRRLNPDGTYVTILRKGHVDDSARARRSQPIPANAGLPRALEDDLNNGKEQTRGVIFLGPDQKRRAHKWRKMENDDRREDLYTMAAPITIRRCGPDGKLQREMAMVLFANHTRNVFLKWHCDIVRCCVDTVSTAFSVGFQLIQAASDAGNPPAAAPVQGLVGGAPGAQVSGVEADDRAKSPNVKERDDASRTG